MSGTQRTSLYDPAYERDSCGFGLIAQLDDTPSRELVEAALDALRCMSHRGAVGADGKTGDGCGLLLRRPTALITALAAEAGLHPGGIVAAGLVFLPHDPALAAQCRSELEVCLEAQSLPQPVWRVVATRPDTLGAEARNALPQIEQVFVAAPPWMAEAAFERALFMARRKAESRLAALADFYVVTLSAHSLGYKAMTTPEGLAEFYPDLSHPQIASSCAVFHQRFSTNTRPRWPLAQPFRLLAHNGEINSIRGNRSWALARGSNLRSPLIDFRELEPLVSMSGSDSQSLDNMLEVLLVGGMDLLQALRVLIPPAWQAVDTMDADLRAFYEYFALHMEPWDGPAGLVMHDGRYAACALDRNGLRPSRWLLTRDRHLVIGSETGIYAVAPTDVMAKGRLGPGQMLAVDFERGELLDNTAIDSINKARAPFKRWLKQGAELLESDLIDPQLAAEPMPLAELNRFEKLFGVTREEREQVLRVLGETQEEATGSMGDDTPLPALSTRVRSLFDSFRQAFAQVTNPPIDPIRERLVMSLHTQIARESNIFEIKPDFARQIELNSPILSQRKFLRLLELQEADGRPAAILDLHYPESESLEEALQRICVEAQAAVESGRLLLVLSDRKVRDGFLPVHALLATGAVHQHLVRAGLRSACNLAVETGTARDSHHFACLIGYGATVIYPYLAYQCLWAMLSHGEIENLEARRELGRNYRRGIRKGLFKIMSKMGISSIASYRGSQLFEIVGLAPEVVARCFEGTPSRIAGPGFAELEADQRSLARRAFDANLPIEHNGLFRYVHDGERHAYNPDSIATLQQAVLSGERADWDAFASEVNDRVPLALRDLLAPQPIGPPVPLDQVESVETILKRFDSAGMSLGALSPEAHEALAIAMNRLGGRSNSGEGGEDPLRYGTEKRSKIKQVASGRFGVTPSYLASAEVLQIKIAQGAKPGEGGQLPGHKVNELIARLRYARPGVGLISPPPHHDIYSIEDLAQLIYDLKQVNPRALVSVKLVAHAGIGTIAAGVVKAGADLITVSGHDGGTGASPLSSIRYAGVPWELGLSEVHQTLALNGLRGQVILQTDGGLKTGLDVIKAAMLGADSFGFGTAPMVALGCKYLRICHLNSCATGVATQHAKLRQLHFKGLPERVMQYFHFVAEETRERLAALGARSLSDLIAQGEYLTPRADLVGRLAALDLTALTALRPVQATAKTVRSASSSGGLADRLDAACAHEIDAGHSVEHSDVIRNTDRSIGARLSGRIALKYGEAGAPAPVRIRLNGSAGQSFGVWNAAGLELELEGEANDYVGKGMAGGRIVLRAPRFHGWGAEPTTIMGNTCLYGATGGELFAAGCAGERFAVRNSGAIAVIEGAGDHCCEYMTGGVVLVLGRTGINFGAGFTGGFAYVLDDERDFVDRYNHELIDIHRIVPEAMEHHMQHLRGLIRRHVELTGSARGDAVLDDFRGWLGRFWLVKPKAASIDSLVDALKRAA